MKKKKLKDHPKYMENREKLEALGNKLHVGKYYESEKIFSICSLGFRPLTINSP